MCNKHGAFRLGGQNLFIFIRGCTALDGPGVQNLCTFIEDCIALDRPGVQNLCIFSRGAYSFGYCLDNMLTP